MDGAGPVQRFIARRKVAAVAQLDGLGMSRASLYRALKQLQDAGDVVRVRRGVYRSAERAADVDSWTLAAEQYPLGVLCLLSALLFHRLTTQAPGEVWLAVPKSAWRKTADYPPIRLVHLSGAAYERGIEVHARPSGKLRVYSAAKTVADCFKFRHRIGLDVALEALREGWTQRRFTLDQLDAMARVCRVQKVMRPYIEGLVA